MRTLAGVSTCAALLGCSNPDAAAHSVDVNAAAVQAEGDMANYAAAQGRKPAVVANRGAVPPAHAAR